MPELCSRCGKQLYKNGNCRGCSQRGRAAPQRTFRATAEWISVHRAANMGNKKRLGMLHTAETRLKMSAAQKGKSRPRRSGIVKHTEEWKQRCRNWMEGNRNGLSGKNVNTSIELRVRAFLSIMGLRFEQQRHFKRVGAVDFFLPEYQVAIECDGAYWHGKPGAKERDTKKDNALNTIGVKVLRLGEKEINKEPENCMTKIAQALRGE